METTDTLRALAKDLTQDYPRSPRETLGGFVIAGRALDKCRALLAGSIGEYHYACPLDNRFFEFSGIYPEVFKEFVATGASDDEVGEWIRKNAKVQDRREIVQWNNEMRYLRPCDLSIELQEFLEGYLPQVIPPGKIVYTWFDVYDIEEKRI